MSNGEELNEVLDVVDEEERSLARLLGTPAYRPGVRALLERLALRAWRRGDETKKKRAAASKAPPPLPKGVRDRSLDASQKATPINSPRGAVREVVVPLRPGAPKGRR